MTRDRDAIWWRDCSKLARRWTAGVERSRGGASPAWPQMAYSILRRRASRRSIVSIAVLSKVFSIAIVVDLVECKCGDIEVDLDWTVATN